MFSIRVLEFCINKNIIMAALSVKIYSYCRDERLGVVNDFTVVTSLDMGIFFF